MGPIEWPGVAVGLTLLIQFGGFIWFAATLRADVRNLTSTVNDLKETVGDYRGLATRVARLEVITEKGK